MEDKKKNIIIIILGVLIVLEIALLVFLFTENTHVLRDNLIKDINSAEKYTFSFNTVLNGKKVSIDFANECIKDIHGVLSVNENDTRILKGTDGKDYYALVIDDEYDVNQTVKRLFIIDDNSKIIYKDYLQCLTDIKVKEYDSKYDFYKDKQYVMDNNKINYLSYNCLSSDDYKFVEKELTVGNNKVNVKMNDINVLGSGAIPLCGE